MKVNEARVIIFLSGTDKRFHYASEISTRLKIDYAYLLKTLKSMKAEGWVFPMKRQQKVFYKLFDDPQVREKARDTLSKFNV